MRRKLLRSSSSTTSMCSLTFYLLSYWLFSFCVAMCLERPRISVAWMAAARLLQLMTLRMNLRPSEGNAQQNVPAFPANDQLHLKSKVERSILRIESGWFSFFPYILFAPNVPQVWQFSEARPILCQTLQNPKVWKLFARLLDVTPRPPDLIKSKGLV